MAQLVKYLFFFVFSPLFNAPLTVKHFWNKKCVYLTFKNTGEITTIFSRLAFVILLVATLWYFFRNSKERLRGLSLQSLAALPLDNPLGRTKRIVSEVLFQSKVIGGGVAAAL